MNQPENCCLLESLGLEKPLTEDAIEDLIELVQTVLYSGRTLESYVKTRIRLYQQQTQHSSMSLPPDHNSLWQTLKTAQLQIADFLSSDNSNFDDEWAL